MSILESHLDLLAGQVMALPGVEASASPAELVEAIGMSISLFQMIEDRVIGEPESNVQSLCDRWLRGAGQIKDKISKGKTRVPAELTNEFMRAYLRAKSVVQPVENIPGRGKAVSLEEVEREILNRG